MVRHRPIQGESHFDLLEESEVSLPHPHDSLPDVEEVMNDFWSMSGSFIYRHHVVIGVSIAQCELHVVVRVDPVVVYDDALIRRTLGLIALVVIVFSSYTLYILLTVLIIYGENS